MARADRLSPRNSAPTAGFPASAVPVPIGLGIGRLGCLMSGCCYGKPTDLWWGITFTNPDAERISGTPLHVALHPTQILQAIDGFVIDLVRGEQLIEIQTRSFASMRRKLGRLLETHPIRLVHPIPAVKWIVKLDEKAREVSLEAKKVLEFGGLETEAGRKGVSELDRRLRASGNALNPGTTADLTAASLALCTLSGYRP